MSKFLLVIAVVLTAVLVDAHYRYGGGGNGYRRPGGYGGGNGGGNNGTGTGASGDVVRNGAACRKGGTWRRNEAGVNCVCAGPQRAKRHYRGRRPHGHHHGGRYPSGGNGNNNFTWQCIDGNGGTGGGNAGNGTENGDGGGIIPIEE